MNIVIIAIAGIGMMVWYIRPLYNFFAKRKYTLLNEGRQTLTKKIQSGLPAVVFYTIIIGLMLYPAITNDLINNFESGSLIVAELILIFVITRIDKRQTKYSVTELEIKYRGKVIKWDTNPTVVFKKTIFVVLHKPRFIVKHKGTKIVIPVLSRNIEKFIKNAKINNIKDVLLVESIYKNIKNYYVKNNTLEKKLNK